MKLKISLIAKILFLCISLILLSSLSMMYFSYQTAKNTLHETTGQTALNITRSVVTSIDPEQFATLQTPDDMNSDYYISLRAELSNLKEKTGLKYLYTMRRTETGEYIYVVDGTAMSETDSSALGDIETEISDCMKSCFDGTEGFDFSDSKIFGKLISGYVPIKNAAGETIGILAADFDASIMVEKLAQARNNMIIFLIAALAISILISTIFSYMMTVSLKRLQAKILLIQQGDLTIDVHDDRRDEVGNLANSFQLMLNNMALMINNIRTNSVEVIRGVDTLTESVVTSNKSIEKITSSVGSIENGAGLQLETVNDVTLTMERVFTEIESITENVNNVNHASDLSTQDMQMATQILQDSIKQISLVNNTVEETASIMKLLEDKFKEMLSFSSSVASIASRTNLLALNASIEAASVGEHGKGFAVVATEIKKLAEQSGAASKHINDLIALVQSEINNSSKAIDTGVIEARNSVAVMSDVENYLTKVSSSTLNIDSRIKDIDKAIQSIEDDSKNVLSKMNALVEISNHCHKDTKQTSTEAEEQSAIIEEIRQHLLSFRNRIEDLEGTVNQFKVNPQD